MRRQTEMGGVAPAGSSRALRLDPTNLPVRFEARDTRTDSGIRQVELHRERVILRRAVAGIRMAVNVSLRDFLGLRLRRSGGEIALVLAHRDPALSVPLGVSDDESEIAWACEAWRQALDLPILESEQQRGPAPRRRRRNAVSARRPRFLVRRKIGAPLHELPCHRGEYELIARN